MNRDVALVAVAAAAGRCDGAVIVCNGLISRAMCAAADHPRFFYLLGSMGLTAPVAAGCSRFAGRPVFAVEGDGNLVMGLSGLPAVVATARPPFVHVVLDNGVYESTGGQRVLAPAPLLTRTAESAGYDLVRTVTDPAALAAVLATAVGDRRIGFVRAVVAGGAPRHPRVPFRPSELPPRFRAAIGGRVG